jgi:hypothetical protein
MFRESNISAEGPTGTVAVIIMRHNGSAGLPPDVMLELITAAEMLDGISRERPSF